MSDGVLTDEQWAGFLADQDPVGSRLPRTWYEGPFLGNGFLGSILYAEPDGSGIRMTVQHSESQDHRPEIAGDQWGVARLPVGHLTLRPAGRITGVDLRLDLWNAELAGTVHTDRGPIGLRALIRADRPVLLVVTTGDVAVTFEPAEAVSPRIVREPPPAELTPNPPPVTTDAGGVTVVTQPLRAGGATATAR